MRKQTAKLSYRNYIPEWTFAFKFCHLDYYGYDSDNLEYEWREMKEKGIAPLKAKKEKLENENKTLVEYGNEVTKDLHSRPLLERLFYSKDLRSRRNELNRRYFQNINSIEKLKTEIREKEDDIYHLSSMAERLLRDQGFVLVREERDNGKTTSMWEKID